MAGMDFREIFGFSNDMYTEWTEGSDVSLPTRHPPVSKQLERVWFENNAQPDNNFIQNTGAGWANRVTPTGDVSLEDYRKKYFKLFMQNSDNPSKIASYLKESVEPSVLAATKEVWQDLAQEKGLLGSYYVTIEPFEKCATANEFFQKSCKTAKFIKRESKCNDCSKRRDSYCTLMKKHLAHEIPYSRTIASAIAKEKIKKGHLTLEEANTIIDSSNDYRKVTQDIYTKSAINRATPKVAPSPVYDLYKHKEVLAPTNVTAEDERIVKDVVASLIKRGVDYSTIMTKVGSHVGSHMTRKMIDKNLAEIAPINAVAFSDCSNDLKGKVSVLIEDASCSDCLYFRGNRCAKLKAAFVQTRQEELTSDLLEKMKAANVQGDEKLRLFIAKCIESGMSFAEMTATFMPSLGKTEFAKHMQASIKIAKKVSPYSFSKCSGSFYNTLPSVYRSPECTACHYNEGSKCAWVKKSFVNPDLSAEANITYENVAVPKSKSASAPTATKEEQHFVKVASRMIEQGYSGSDVRAVLASKELDSLDSHTVINAAAEGLKTLDAVAWSRCKEDEVYSHVASLVKTDTCLDCGYVQASRCGKLKLEFSNAEYGEVPLAMATEEDPYELFRSESGDINFGQSSLEI